MIKNSKTDSLLLILIYIALAKSLNAEVRAPHIFNNHMIIQRNREVKIWGWGDKNEKVEVSFNKQLRTTKVDKNGYWSVILSSMSHGGPYEMIIKGSNNKIVFSDILIGDVWLCSGQSNMQFTVKESNNARKEISEANYPLIRSFNVRQEMSLTPEQDFTGEWDICSPSTVGDFSAVGYFFARKLYQELNIPIGIINSSWGGTDIETWTSPIAFSTLDDQHRAKYSNVEITDLQAQIEKNKANKEAFGEALKDDFAMNEKWYTITNTSSWNDIETPSLWSKTDLATVNGYVWFNYKINLPKASKGKSAKIYLGPIDDADITWINGAKVGENDGYAINRIYDIPQGVLINGDNSITIKVINYSGEGGIYGNPSDMYLDIEGEIFPLHGTWKYKESVSSSSFNYMEVTPNILPSLLYNAMINPIIQFPIKGVIWYQGENNAYDAYNYRTLFPNLINDWRHKWGYDFPFYWVQLANFRQQDQTPQESDWAELREAQTYALSLLRSGQAIATDIGDANDIHPRNKQDVGLRLALNALNKDYGKNDIVFSGPTFQSMEIVGNEVIIHFDNLGSGLDVHNKYKYLQGFTIAGIDKRFVWANAIIKDNKVIVSSEKIDKPIAVRYNWANNPDGNLYNKDGLPATPFRTDTWKGITEK